MRGVLFDLDETLIDRRRSISRYADDFFTEFRRLLQFERPDFISTLIRLDGNGYVTRVDFFSALAEAIDHPELPAQRIEEHFLATIWQQPLLVNGALVGLRRLRERNIPIALVTNGAVRNQQTKIINSGIAELVDGWIISEAFGTKKPDPAIYLTAAEQIGIEPEGSWFVGDHPLLDIEGAARCGFRTIWLERNTPWPADLPRCCDHGPCSLMEAFDILAGELNENGRADPDVSG